MSKRTIGTRGIWGGVLAVAIGCASGSPNTSAKANATAGATGAAGVAAAPASYGDAPEPPIPEPRTGELAPVDGERVTGQLVARGKDGDAEVLEFKLAQGDGGGVVMLDAPGALAVLQPGGTLLVRRPPSGAPVKGAVIQVSWHSPTYRHPLELQASGGPISKDAGQRFWAAFATSLEGSGSGPFRRFAAARVRERFLPTTGAAAAALAGRSSREATLRAMDTLTGRTSIEEALQADRPLLVAARAEKATVAIDKVAPPALRPHPFPEMLRALGKPVPAEPMARAVPAAFWYVRLDSLDTLFRLEDELDAWATPLASAANGRSEGLALSERYQTALGLRRGPLSRALGAQVVGQLAIAGSDPYVRDGTDLTVIFQVKSRTLFDAAVGATLADFGRTHGGLTEGGFDHGAVRVRAATSADGAVRQHRADVTTPEGELSVVSNSAGAMRRVLDTIAGKGPRLADEPDLRYLLARDAKVETNALVFLGDRFVAEVAGPRQKIGQLRRMIAQAELAVPGYAQLLYGRIHGRTPASTADLLKSRLLVKEDLVHGAGGAISFAPGTAARSRFGTSSALVPLADLPAVDRVTVGERDAYVRFAETYQMYWRAYVDPIAIRLRVAPTELAADVRVLPLIEASEYRKLVRTVGKARVTTPGIEAGMRWVLGIGQDAELRRFVSGTARHSPFGQFALDWLGDWAMAGIEDKVAVAQFALRNRDMVSQRPAQGDERVGSNHFEDLLRLPLHGGIEVRSTAGAIAFLAGVKQTVDSSAPGLVEWTRLDHRGVAIMRVRAAAGTTESRRLAERGMADAALYYALAEGALLVALQEAVIKRRIDERKDGRGPEAGKQADTQLVFDVAARATSPLGKVLTWALDREIARETHHSFDDAFTLLHGAPELRSDPGRYRAAAIATLGRVPLTPDGQPYTWTDDGVTDPVRGSMLRHRWPKLPVAGSAVERLVSSLVRLRGEVGFDEEPGPTPAGGERLGSLHARVTVGLGAR